MPTTRSSAAPKTGARTRTATKRTTASAGRGRATARFADSAEIAASLAGRGGSCTVYLAEKHSIAQALADALPGRSIRRGGYIECGDALITWLSGHLLEQAPPEAYDERLKTWSRDTLPIVPQPFRLLVRQDRDIPRQLEVIRALLQACPTAVNAADFDREGQLLVDEVLELVGYRGRVLRLQTRALDRTSLVRELKRMRSNDDFIGLREAARARSRLDWLAGMNLTRAMTLHGRQCGVRSVLSLGRVQTPTLGLVVERDEVIEHFEPKPFYKLECPFTAPNGVLQTFLVTAADMAGVDSERRLVDRQEALRIRDLVSGRQGVVSLTERRLVREAAPLPYSLTELQKEASARYGLGAQATLEACQALYEAKFVSYPRTDCQYLPQEQFGEAATVLQAIAAFDGMRAMVDACDPSRHSAAWNTSRVSAHHAIIPTGVPASGLGQREARIYAMICRRYAWQFLPPHVFHKTRVEVTCESFLWRANGRIEESPGWTAFRDTAQARKARAGKDGGEEDRDVVLPVVEKGELVQAGEVAVNEAMTTPPARFTEGSLVDAMENIQRYLKGASAEDQGILKKTEGLGTVATRATIIETLFARGYLEKHGKTMQSTPLGRALVHNSPAAIRDPLMTADMERCLSEIQEGRLDADAYVAAYAATLPRVIDEIFALPADFGEIAGKAQTCPLCGSPLQRRRTQKGTYFWGCSKSPECTYTAGDRNGLPVAGRGRKGGTTVTEQGAAACPRCGKPLVQRKGSRGAFWGCSGFPTCRFTAEDGGGRPVLPQGAAGTRGGGGPMPQAGPAGRTRAAAGAGTVRGHGPEGLVGAPAGPGSAEGQPGQGNVCPRCGRPLVQRNSFRGPFLGCSGYPSCRYTRDLGQGPAGSQGGGPALDPGQPGQMPGQNTGQLPARSAGRNTGPVPHGPGPAEGQPGQGNVCPRCGRALVQRNGSRGPFLGCSGYPSCRYTRDLDQGPAGAGQGPRQVQPRTPAAAFGLPGTAAGHGAGQGRQIAPPAGRLTDLVGGDSGPGARTDGAGGHSGGIGTAYVRRRPQTMAQAPAAAAAPQAPWQDASWDASAEQAYESWADESAGGWDGPFGVGEAADPGEPPDWDAPLPEDPFPAGVGPDEPPAGDPPAGEPLDRGYGAPDPAQGRDRTAG